MLDPLEEQLNLPAFLVEIGHGCRLQVMGIGNETVLVAVVGDELDEPQLVFHSLEPDLLIEDNTLGFAAGPLLEVFHQGVVFESGDEEDAVGGQFLPPLIVGEALVEDGKRALGQLQHSGPGHLVLLAFGHIDELGQVTVGIQTDV